MDEQTVALIDDVLHDYYMALEMRDTDAMNRVVPQAIILLGEIRNEIVGGNIS